MAGSTCRCSNINCNCFRPGFTAGLSLSAVLAFFGGTALAQEPTVETSAVGFSDGISLTPDETRTQSQTQAQIQDAPAPDASPSVPARPWWLNTTGNSELRLLRVDTRPGEPLPEQAAIGLAFSHPFAANEGFADQLALYRADSGERLESPWQRAADATYLYARVPGAGVYVLRLRAGLRDAHGHTFNQSLSGPLEVGAAENQAE